MPPLGSYRWRLAGSYERKNSEQPPTSAASLSKIKSMFLKFYRTKKPQRSTTAPRKRFRTAGVSAGSSRPQKLPTTENNRRPTH